MISSETIKTGGWSVFFLLALFMAFGTLMLNSPWYVYFFLLASIRVWTMYVVYVCESYVTYMWSLLISSAGGFTLSACVVAYGLAADASYDSNLYRLLVGITPAALVGIVYTVVTNMRPACQPFEYDGNRIQTRQDVNPKSSMNYSFTLTGGLTALAAGIFLTGTGLLTSALVGMTIMTGGSILVLLYGRHVLRGLRTLRIQQKTMPTPYTFMQIDEIRAARNRWWLSRLFKWIASWRKSSDA